MVVVEKVTRVLFGALFGWVIVMLAVETLIRRRLAARRRAELEAAFQQHPQLRPTVEFEALGRKHSVPAGRA